MNLKTQQEYADDLLYAPYRHDPCGYAERVLRVKWWERQQEIARLLLVPPYRVLVKASHSVGKSHLAGGLVNWWYDTRNPGVCLTTAPTSRQVKDILWKEVRRQRRGRGGFAGPRLPRLESSESHFAFGFTADNAASFQGQHEVAVLIIIDEAIGVHGDIWEAIDSMAMGEEFAVLAICNPTDTSSEFYQREQAGGWHVVHIPCTEHPNLKEELAGRPPLYPAAARLSWFEERLKAWSVPVSNPEPTDIEWPPGSGKWYRPGPLAQSRLLARYPSQGTGVWSEALWDLIAAPQPLLHAADQLPEIGLDVARFGDDYTCFHVRWGNTSLLHESWNGLGNDEVIGNLRRLCKWAADYATQSQPSGQEPIKPEDIYCKADSDGMGGRIEDHADGYNWEEVSAGRTASEPAEYGNIRSELWFNGADLAKERSICVALLPEDVQRELKRQAMAPRYKLDGKGRRVVEDKKITKKRLKRSPDDMDAFNLAYYQVGGSGDVATAVDTGPRRRRHEGR